MKLTVRGTSRTTAEVLLDDRPVRHALGLTVKMGAGKYHEATLDVAAIDPDLEIEEVDPTIVVAGRRFRLEPPEGVRTIVGRYMMIATKPMIVAAPGRDPSVDVLREIMGPLVGKRVRLTIEVLPDVPEKDMSPGGEGDA